MKKDVYKYDDLIRRETVTEIMEKSDRVGNLPLIIAMKGDAYTGKTACADAIAKSFRCSVVRFDTILDSICPSLPPPPQRQTHIDLAFDVIVSVVKLQLRTGRPVVIDSPLSNPAHLHKLIQLADELKYCGKVSCEKRHSRFVIVECRPEAKYSWELRFRNKCGSSHDKWYKPKEWSDVVFTQSVVDDVLPDFVCRLIVDTTGYVDLRYLGAATLDLSVCDKGHLLNFRDWLPDKPYHGGFPVIPLMDDYLGRFRLRHHEEAATTSTTSTMVICGDDGRHLLDQEMLSGSGCCCQACGGAIEEQCYACKRCNKFAMHTSCAEMKGKTMIDHPNELPPFLRKMTERVSEDEYYSKIPEEHRIKSGGSCKEFSVECEACLWEAHLRSGVVPTVLRHEGHSLNHIICFWITSVGKAREYQCDACKMPGWLVGYTCLGGTFRYNFHVECVLLRRPRRHVHGRHNHDMKLSFSTVENTDDFYCEECQEPRLPTAWYYSCVQCSYVSHLHCVYAPAYDTSSSVTA